LKSEYILKIGSNGEILLPKEVREYLKFGKDQPVLMRVYSNRIIIHKIESLESILNSPATAKISYHVLKQMDSEFD